MIPEGRRSLNVATPFVAVAVITPVPKLPGLSIAESSGIDPSSNGAIRLAVNPGGTSGWAAAKAAHADTRTTAVRI
ncbi:MAG: hypothetical protein K8E66_04725, partial [Phycisphaerales bacterium]|nr:hypothetical protein [Phycisphaerales bacterium]